MGSNFDKLLFQLNEELIEMGNLVEEAISNAVNSLTKNCDDCLDKANEIERQVDQKEKDIENLCLKILLHQHPVAGDLRVVSSALKMITDMERIGDQAEDISEISITMKSKAKHKTIEKMAEATTKMVADSISAFVNRDEKLALSVIHSDDYVDSLFDEVKEEATDLILQSSAYGEEAIDIMMIAKYFERIGDHATNIAEWVYFSITGVHEYADE